MEERSFRANLAVGLLTIVVLKLLVFVVLPIVVVVWLLRKLFGASARDRDPGVA